ncbi:hypothetical protein [Actinomadura fibrosa]|uniref:Uncharacterized protein n=1 Tax=Actinomadura fibrosa TaxID=111802 RepID=A0ABW2XJP6_9ACTN
MNALPYLAGLATRHAWAERRYAALQAEIVEARLTARAVAEERAARRRRAVRELGAGVRGQVEGWVRGRRAAEPPLHCARAAARSAGAARRAPAVRTAGGVR